MIPENWTDRTSLLLGPEKVDKLAQAHVLIAGLGGVGSAAAEMLCRAGIGSLSLIDFDRVHPSNRNRQLIALKSTEGKTKVDVLAERLTDINPEIRITKHNCYINEESISEIFTIPYDYVVDAIDTLSPKVLLISNAVKRNLKLVSSLGSGGRTDPTMVSIADISETHDCRFGYYVRKRLHKLGIESGFKTVFSTEKVPRSVIIQTSDELNKKTITGTISYMPVVFGCYCAFVVVDS